MALDLHMVQHVRDLPAKYLIQSNFDMGRLNQNSELSDIKMLHGTKGTADSDSAVKVHQND